LAIATAGYTVDNGAVTDLAGVLLYDPVALNNETPTAMAKLGNDIPVLAVTAPPYFWNQWGATTAALVAARPGQFNGVELAGGSHVDSSQSGNPLIQLGMALAAGFSQPQNIAAVQTLAAGWVNDWLNPDEPPTGIYAAPGATIHIGTSAGTATATALPAPHAPPSLLDQLLQALIAIGQPALFNFEPVDGAAMATSLQTQELTQLSV
jgi:hypothetical protein